METGIGGSFKQINMVVKYDSSRRKICLDIFYDVYKNPPFNYKWLKIEDVCRYFNDIESTPNFYGFVFIVENQTVGVCLGTISDYFLNSKYSIDEIYIRREFQNKGLGKKMLSEIEEFLIQNNIAAVELKTSKNRSSFMFYKNSGYEISKEIVYMFKMLGQR